MALIFIWFTTVAGLTISTCFGLTSGNLIEEIVTNILPNCYYTQVQSYDETSLKNEFNKIYQVPGIQIDLATLDFQLTITKLGSNQVIRHQHQCLTFIIQIPLLTSSVDGTRLLNFFSSKSFQYQAGFSYLIFYADSFQASDFLLNPIFANFPHRILLTTTAQTFTPKGTDLYRFCSYCFQGQPGLTVTTGDHLHNQPLTFTNLFPDDTRQMGGRLLIFTAPPAPPLVALIPSKSNPRNLEIVGMQKVILKSMATLLNFTYRLRPASQGLTGIQFPNGSWNGIMDEVLTGTADIGLSVATSYYRNKVFDFTTPVFNAFLVLVSMKPSPFFNWEAIFYPFRTTTWLALLACTVFTVVTYRILHNKGVQLENSGQRSRKVRNRFISLFQSTYYTVGALLEQGYSISARAVSSRTFISFWFFAGIVITCAYRSKLFLFLTFPTVDKPPSTFQELAVSKYRWGLKSLGGVGLLFITQSPLADVRYIGEKLEISTDKYSCLDRTIQEKFVCVIYRAYVDYMLELRYWNMKHKFFVSDYLTPPVGSSWVLRKYSPLLPVLDKFHSAQFEMGLAAEYVNHYQQSVAKEFRIQARNPTSKVDKFEPNINFVPEGDETKPLRLGNLYGPFFICCFGYALATLMLIIELVQAVAMKRRKLEAFALRSKFDNFRSLARKILIDIN